MYVIEASALNERPALLASEERGKQDLKEGSQLWCGPQDLVWHSYMQQSRGMKLLVH